MTRLFAPALIALAFAADDAAETRDLSGFRAVEARDRMSVTVATGEAYSVEVTGADAARVRTRLDGRTLEISEANRPWFRSSPRLDAHVRVTAPSLEGVSASRGVDLTATLGGECGDFSAAAAMGGSARMTGIQCSDVRAAASMGGDLALEGSCRGLDVSAAMGGFVRAEQIACETVDASASMGGDIRANASRSYQASASMGGAIDVAGAGASNGRATLMGGSITDGH